MSNSGGAARNWNNTNNDSRFFSIKPGDKTERQQSNLNKDVEVGSKEAFMGE